MADNNDEIKIKTNVKVTDTSKITSTSGVSKKPATTTPPSSTPTPPSSKPPSAPFEPIAPPDTINPTPSKPSEASDTSEQPGLETEPEPEQQNQPDEDQRIKDQTDNNKIEDESNKEPSEEKTKEPSEETKPSEEPETPEKPVNPEAQVEPNKPETEPGALKDEEAVKNNKPVDLGKSKDASKAGKTGLHEVEGAAKKGEKQAAKRGLKVAAQAAKKAILAALQAAIDAIVAFFGWWILAIIGIICLVIIIIFLFIAAYAANGGFGKTLPQHAASDSIEVRKVSTLNTKAAGGTEGTTNGSKYHNFDFIDAKDKTYMDEGKIDKRLLSALEYLSGKHNRIAVSHMISAYEDMNIDNDETASNRDPNLVKNISAHKDGLAADISQIDFVYKSLEPSKLCTSDPPLNDIVYTSDGMPTTDPATIGETDTPATFSETAATLNTTTTTIDQSNPGSKEISDKLQNVKNQIGQISQNLGANANNTNNLKNNVTAVNNNIQNIRNTINKSDLPQDQKDALNKKVDVLSDSLSNLTYKYIQLSIVMMGEQEMIYRMNDAIQADLNNQIDIIVANFNQLSNMQNISVIRDLGAINDQLSKINSDFGNLDVLGGELDGLGGLLGSSNELLHLYCEGGPATPVSTKEAIPIKVSWQDTKPDIPHVSADKDESLTTDPRVFYAVYQPQARIKTHQVISELLQFPYDMKTEKNSIADFRVTQIETYSEERDVLPFTDILDKLYGQSRSDNFGLFSMPESWAQVHMAY